MKYLFTLLLGYSFAAFAQNKVVTDSLMNQLVNERNDTVKVNLYNQLAWEYRNSDFAVTDSFADLAIRLGEKAKFCKGSGNGYINKAFVYRNAGKYDLALKSLRWALVKFLPCNYQSGYSSVYNNIAGIHYNMGNYALAQYYYYQSLKISESMGDLQGTARSLNNIGVVLMEQKMHAKALTHFERCYAILERLKDENGMADCLNNIGSIYQARNNTEKAVSSYARCASINEKIGDKKDVSAALHNIGLTYSNDGDHKQALNYFLRSLSIDESLGDIPAIAISLQSIADCYIELKMYHAAKKYALETLDIGLNFSMKTDIMNAYELLYRIEQQHSNFKKALEYHLLYKQYSDSIFNAETTEHVANLEEQYLKEKFEKQQIISSKEEEIGMIRTQEKEHAVTQYIFIIGLVLIIFVSLVYIVFFLMRKTKYS